MTGLKKAADIGRFGKNNLSIFNSLRRKKK